MLSCLTQSSFDTFQGLSFSGCDSVEARESVEDAVKKGYPNLSKHYFVGGDTVGSIATASLDGLFRFFMKGRGISF